MARQGIGCNARRPEGDVSYLCFLLVNLAERLECSWSPLTDDNEWSQTTVGNALSALPNLRILDLDLKHCKVPLRLDRLTGLNTIVLSNVDYARDSEHILDVFAKMVAKSPQLTSIEILPVWSYLRQVAPIYSLHQIFKYYPTDIPPLRLHHLGLNACLLRIDHTTLPHIKHLKSLRLRSFIDPYAAPYDGYEKNPNNGEEQKKVGSHLDSFWRTMATEGIWLEKIVHQDVGPGFLDYLSSYSGLKALTLTPDPWYRSLEYSNPMARQFFANLGPLFRHSQSLEDLRIDPCYEGDWCVDTYNVAAISACTNLKEFGMSVLSGQLLRRDTDDNTENGVVSA